MLATLWFVVCLIIPQLGVERSLHPFFNWSLFAPVYGSEHRYALKITKCGSELSPPTDVLTEANFKPYRKKFHFHFRLLAIAELVEKGKWDPAVKSLKMVVKNTLVGYEKCEFVMYRGDTFDAEKKWHGGGVNWEPIEETKFENQ